MKERPILLNAEMARAVLDGRKTQTRRMLTPRQLKMIDAAASIGECYPLESGHQHGNSQSYYREWCPFGAVGDRLWVRETFATLACGSYEPEKPSWSGSCQEARYRATDRLADLSADIRGYGWRPSIHMPRWASRITLEITGVRVERLNAISQEDAHAEGLELTGWRPTYYDPDSGGEVMTPYDNFAELWSSIYGEESWQANPWVWVIDFKRLDNADKAG
ncbi:morphogenetic protein [Pantoea sp. V106_11]|uniref:morphogenetic protein n=1 Tax=Pantoea sp. V106_11 TaxID=3044234 RepID=UPI00249E3B07|nr:morphogenetic protein [Pantoea sp. V106_11]MDI3415678.1 morphogenetic protein [Pantoea sp. V106_11]